MKKNLQNLFRSDSTNKLLDQFSLKATVVAVFSAWGTVAFFVFIDALFDIWGFPLFPFVAMSSVADFVQRFVWACFWTLLPSIIGGHILAYRLRSDISKNRFSLKRFFISGALVGVTIGLGMMLLVALFLVYLFFMGDKDPGYLYIHILVKSIVVIFLSFLAGGLTGYYLFFFISSSRRQ